MFNILLFLHFYFNKYWLYLFSVCDIVLTSPYSANLSLLLSKMFDQYYVLCVFLFPMLNMSQSMPRYPLKLHRKYNYFSNCVCITDYFQTQCKNKHLLSLWVIQVRNSDRALQDSLLQSPGTRASPRILECQNHLKAHCIIWLAVDAG